MADCGKYDDMISALVDGELTDSELEDLDKHILYCRSCTEQLELFTTMSSVLNDIEEAPPYELSSSIMKQIVSDSKKSKKGRGLRRLTAIAAVLVVVITGLFILKQVQPFNGSSNDGSTIKYIAAIDAPLDISPEELPEASEASQEIDTADIEPNNSSSASNAYSYGIESEPPVSEESGQTANIFNEDSSTIEVLFTDVDGNEITKPIAADLFDKLLTYSGVHHETVAGEPVCKIKTTIDGTEQIYSIWVSNESVLVQGTDGVINISAISIENFEDLLS